MAISKKDDTEYDPFVMPDTETKPLKSLKGVPPSIRGNKEIMADDDKRDYAAKLLSNLSGMMLMPKVRSNHELVERIDQYLTLCSDQRIPPTWEGLGLFCGYTRATLWDWMTKKNKGFQDEVGSGLLTSDVIKRAREILAAFDGTMAAAGKINPVAYIYRSSNFYGMVNKQTVAVEPMLEEHNAPRSPEEIAKDLPDLVDTDYTIE